MADANRQAATCRPSGRRWPAPVRPLPVFDRRAEIPGINAARPRKSGSSTLNARQKNGHRLSAKRDATKGMPGHRAMQLRKLKPPDCIVSAQFLILLAPPLPVPALALNPTRYQLHRPSAVTRILPDTRRPRSRRYAFEIQVKRVRPEGTAGFWLKGVRQDRAGRCLVSSGERTPGIFDLFFANS